MSDKNKDKGEKSIFTSIEGTHIKGGINPSPSTERPSHPPKGQSPQQPQGQSRQHKI